ncbi:MAG: ScpA family protein [Chloroflexi bacterium]|nr:ScpA family protein [Chloroflexota bacterium]MCY3937754.1 ScpA family protein [Chloroflexota bacterium]
MLGSWRTGTPASPLAKFNLELDSFDGPFDLLVHLIENQGFDITTVSLQAVTSQYLSYVEDLQRQSAYAEATSEFLAVASQLLFLKSQAFLPSQTDDEDAGGAMELADRLRVYSAYRKLAAELDELQLCDRPSFPRMAPPPEFAPEVPDNWEDVSELVFALDSMRERRRENEATVAVPLVRFDLQQHVQSIRETLTRLREVTFDALTAECGSRSDVVHTFLAVLHLVARRSVTVRQRKAFGPITISTVEGDD